MAKGAFTLLHPGPTTVIHDHLLGSYSSRPSSLFSVQMSVEKFIVSGFVQLYINWIKRCISFFKLDCTRSQLWETSFLLMTTLDSGVWCGQCASRGLPVGIHTITNSAAISNPLEPSHRLLLGHVHLGPGVLTQATAGTCTPVGDVPTNRTAGSKSIRISIFNGTGKLPHRRVLPIYTTMNKGRRYLSSQGLATLDISSKRISFSPPLPSLMGEKWYSSLFKSKFFPDHWGGGGIRHFFILVEKPQTL